jgi:hypothetical protein
MSSSDHREISVETENRKFDVSILKYDNGFFISITEGAKKLGAMMISVAAGPAPSSSEIIPIRQDSLFLKLISQKIAAEVRGLCVVSLYAKHELGPNASKVLIEKIMETIRN